MNPDRLKEAILSLFSVFANQGTGYLPDTIKMPSSFAKVEQPFQFDFNGKRYQVSLAKSNLWVTTYSIAHIGPNLPPPKIHPSLAVSIKKRIHVPTFKALFEQTAKAKEITCTEFARSLGFRSLASIAPLYHSTEEAQYKHTDKFVEAFGTDSFVLPSKPKAIKAPKIKSPVQGVVPYKAERLPIDREAFQQLTGYPHVSRIEICHLLGFSECTTLLKLFEGTGPYMTTYANHLIDQLGEGVMWQPKKKIA